MITGCDPNLIHWLIAFATKPDRRLGDGRRSTNSICLAVAPPPLADRKLLHLPPVALPAARLPPLICGSGCADCTSEKGEAEMTPKEAALALHNSQYRSEGSPELFRRMKEHRLVAVFGASDDLMEFNGAINDEISAYEGATAYLDQKGLLVSECHERDDCPYFKKACKSAAKVDAVWCPEGREISWVYETAIPHEKFLIMEDDEVYCEGIVFSLDDVRGAA